MLSAHPREHARWITSCASSACSACRCPIFWQAAMLILALSLWFNWVPPVDLRVADEDPLANLTQMIAAGARAGNGGGGPGDADDALVAAGGACARTTSGRPARRGSPRGCVVWRHALQERADPDHHGDRRPGRLPARRRGGDRGGVHAAGRWPAGAETPSTSATIRWCRARSCSSRAVHADAT